ncbi:heavy metal-associated isoprenylated plant protein 7-like [Andrographis paniculata]|uniref:heavy metal-associated isoprenylated plant protein 7-like n=1 Tax=Andrographis paniculata TaxID=175694 RepID=UPI0021E8DB09|nr:heavy metal-associated isoprenylated plant protein 7-like [Andrographis paniculata]
MGEEKKKPAEETKPAAAEESAKAEKAAGDAKKEEKKSDEPQEIVLKVFMHCEACARKVHRCLKGFEGVEEVKTDCRTSKVIVKGENADPVKVLHRVQKKSHRQVELISPIPKPPAPEPPKPPENEATKPEEKNEEPQVISVMLGVFMHCDACAQEIKRRILRMKGVESAEPDLKNSKVAIKGVFDPAKLCQYVYKRTGKHATIIKVDPDKKEAAAEEPKQEKKAAEDGEKDKNTNKGTNNNGEQEKNETATGNAEADPMVMKNEMMLQNQYPNYGPAMNNLQMYPQRYAQEMNGYGYGYPPQMFSDENPNACRVM